MKVKKKRGFRKAVLLLLLAAVLGACIYLYPVWKSARLLKEHMDTGNFAYELEIELDRTEMEAGQISVLENMAKLTGFEEDALFCLTIRGSVWEDKIHALIYTEDTEDPLMEFYLSNDISVINSTLPYNTIRRNLTAKHALLEHLMPAESEAVYMTLEQAEEIFGLDLSGIRSFSLPDSSVSRSAAGYFLLLVFSSKESNEWGKQYEIVYEQAELKAEIADSSVRIRFNLENPGQMAEQHAELLSRLGIRLPVRELGLLKSFSAVIMPGAGDKVEIPARIMDQEKVNLIVEIKDLVTKLLF